MRGAREHLGRVGVALAIASPVAGLCAAAEAETYPHHPVNFTLYYPAGTNQDKTISTSFQLSLIYGHIGALRGVGINTGVSLLDRQLHGVQATLLYSQLKGSFKGVTATGLVNYYKARSCGVQIAGLGNVNQGDFDGIQYGGAFNFTDGNFWGAQISSFFNQNDDNLRYLQAAAFANVNGGDLTGAQLAVGFNFNGGKVRGLQIGLANAALEISGFQAGVLNMVRNSSGVQLGVVNWGREMRGVPIGPLNFASNGNADWITFASNLSAVNTGIRTTVNNFYSMLTLGYGDLQGDVEKSIFITWNYGYQIRVTGPWNMGVDVGYTNIAPQAKSSEEPDKNTSLHPALQARLLADVRFSPLVSVFAAVGVSSIYSEYSSDAKQETEPLVVGGISLF